MRTLVKASLILGAVLGIVYIIRDYIRDETRTRVQLLEEDLEEEAAPNNEEADFRRVVRKDRPPYLPGKTA